MTKLLVTGFVTGLGLVAATAAGAFELKDAAKLCQSEAYDLSAAAEICEWQLGCTAATPPMETVCQGRENRWLCTCQAPTAKTGAQSVGSQSWPQSSTMSAATPSPAPDSQTQPDPLPQPADTAEPDPERAP